MCNYVPMILCGEEKYLLWGLHENIWMSLLIK